MSDLFRGIIYNAITDERSRQDAKWGADQGHSLPEWGTILGEEFGEACQEMNRVHFGGMSTVDLKAELTQVAAVAVAILEALEDQ